MTDVEMRTVMAERLRAVQEAGNYNAKMARGFARMAGHIANSASSTGNNTKTENDKTGKESK